MTVTRPAERFAAWIRLASGWLVALLAILAAGFVIRYHTPGKLMIWLWCALVALALARAAYGSFAFLRDRRSRSAEGVDD